MVISFDGEVDDDIEFVFVGGAKASHGCSATLNGGFTILEVIPDEK